MEGFFIAEADSALRNISKGLQLLSTALVLQPIYVEGSRQFILGICNLCLGTIIIALQGYKILIRW